MKNKRVIVEIRSETVKAELARGGKTYEWLAQRAGVHRHYMGALIRHVRNPGPKMREKIHRAMMELAGLAWHEIFREKRR